MNKKWSVIYFISTFCLSYGLGILFKDRYLMGSTTLFLGFVQTYFMSKGKWYEEFVGIFETIMSTIVCIFACMYGSAFLTILIHIPLSIFSIINWKKHENDNTVKLNKMTLTKSLITIFLVIICTAILSFLLSLIPTQRLAFWDAFGDVLDICGILLVALRYKEGLAIWII
ncbi:MAG: nicotinamide mononucleotide transporter, partial [Clostridia bacterium]|nr:nicotinamide mononucleotide transporter [Clostridia bacterium]